MLLWQAGQWLAGRTDLLFNNVQRQGRETWQNWPSAVSAGHSSGCAATHTASSSRCKKSYQSSNTASRLSRNTKSELANCPVFSHFLFFPSKGWEQSLTCCTQQWFHEQMTRQQGWEHAGRLWLSLIKSQVLLGPMCLLE